MRRSGMWLSALLILLPGLVEPVRAQQGNLLYLQHDVPQTVLLNPAVTIQCRVMAGIPLLSSLNAGYGNSFLAYNDLDNQGNLDLDGVYDQLKRNNLTGINLSYTPVFAGYRRGEHYFNFSVSERAGLNVSFPRVLGSLALYGNNGFIGETARVRNLRVNAMYFREYAAGYSYEYDQFTRLGVRARILFGKAGIRTARSRLDLVTGEDAFHLLATGDVRLNASFPMAITQDATGNITGAEWVDLEWIPLALNRKNPGIGFDLGMIHEYTDELTFSASLLDLGFIRWGTNLNTLSGALEFNFEGFEPDAGLTTRTNLNDIIDSLVNTASIELSQDPYLQILPASLIVGAEYRMKEWFSVGAVSRTTFVNGFIQPSLSFIGNVSPHEHLHASVAWSYMNHSLKHIGFSIAYTGKEMQVFLLSENVLGYFQPFDTRTLHLQFGMSLMFGCPRNRWLIHREEVPSMPMGKCAWTDNHRRKWWKRRR